MKAIKTLLTVIIPMLSTHIMAQDNLKLVWHDEFDGSTLNTANWNVIDGDMGVNNELQYYRPANVWVSDGKLVLMPRQESYGGKSFTSGRIDSNNKVYFTHGRLDARIKMPKTYKGLWPAFWMLGNDTYPNWPTCGEIDVVEMGSQYGYPGQENNTEGFFPATVHWYDASATQYGQGHGMKYGNRNGYSVEDGEYHLYSCVWDGTTIKMYLDLDKYPSEEPFYTLTKTSDINDSFYDSTFQSPFFIVFNVAVGGDFTGVWDASGITAFSQTDDHAMYVDYVRVYQDVKSINAPQIVDNGSTPEDMENGGSETLLPSAPTPTRNASSVTSLYSDTYTNVGNGSAWYTWQSPDAAENFYDYTTAGGDKAWGVNNINYGALNINSDWSTIDVRNRNFLHVDVYSFDNNSIFVGLTSKGPVGDGSDNQSAFVTKMLSPGWNSFDIPFSEMSSANASVDYSRIVQFGWSGGTGYSTFLFDNIYLFQQDAPTTGLSSLGANRNEDCHWYSLNGLSLADRPVAKGIYIHQGKTVAIK